MHCGCVVVAYDVRGNREYLIDGFNGRLVPPGDVERLAHEVVELLAHTAARDELRRASLALVSSAFVGEPRWPALAKFLDLPTSPASIDVPSEIPSREALETALGDPVYMGVDEVPAFVGLTRNSRGTFVEIGAAYGGSTALLLENLPDGSTAVSVDPFVPDSMNGFRASRDRCVRNVVRAVATRRDPSIITRWSLEAVESLSAARDWSSEIGLLYIDGDHRYEAVRDDFLAWSPFLADGAVLVLHDSRRIEGAPDGEFARGWPGPTRLAEELKQHECVELADEVFSMTVWKRTGRRCPVCEAEAR